MRMSPDCPLATRIRSSSRGRKLNCETLSAVDWHSSRRFESHSDGDDDDLPWPEAREPTGTGFQGSGYGGGKGLDGPFFTAKIASGRKEGKGKFPGKPRGYPSSIVMQQHSGPIRLNTGPFSGPLKAAGKPNPAASIIPADAVGKKKPCFDANEPASPEVTCLGRVRIKEKYGKDPDGTAEGNPCTYGRKSEQVQVFDSKKQSGDRKGKAREKKGAAEKVTCLSRRRRQDSRKAKELARVDFHIGLKRLGSAMPATGLSETVETRRERAATLARTLTSLFEDLRGFEKAGTEYVPSVPPPNSLLLMRGCRNVEKLPEQVAMSQLKTNTRAEHASLSEIKMKLRNSLEEQLSLSEMKMEKNAMAEHVSLSWMEKNSIAAQVKYAIAQQAPLSEIENNAMAEHIPLSEMKSKSMDHCKVSLLEPPPGATLWQRRAIANLAAIEIRSLTKWRSSNPLPNSTIENCKSPASEF